jgi:hypothetical protein
MILCFRYLYVKNRKRLSVTFLFLIAFFILVSFSASGQQSINSSAGNASGAAGNVSYSVGQVVYQTFIGATGSVAQGVQQPYEISVFTTTEHAKDIDLTCAAFPNPTKNVLTLMVENYSLEGLSYQLYDISGQLLQNEKITDATTTVSLKTYAAAIYFLKISDGHKEIKMFKINKN